MFEKIYNEINLYSTVKNRNNQGYQVIYYYNQLYKLHIAYNIDAV